LGSTLDKLKKVNGVKFKFKKEYKPKSLSNSTQDEIGFIAQDLEKLFPDVVKVDSTTGAYSIYTLKLIPIIIEALKEQDSVISTQASQIKDLQKLVKNGGSLKSASITTVVNETSSAKASLDQNFPNPFNQSTQIGYYLPETTSTANLYIYNMNGLQIKSFFVQTKGKGSVTINGSELQPGMYIYTLIADGQEIDTKRMILTQ
jgi:hypothetical protein